MKLLLENWRRFLTESAAEEAWELLTQPDENIVKIVQDSGLDKIPGAGTNFDNFVKSESGFKLISMIKKLPSSEIGPEQLAKLKNFNNKLGEESLIKDSLEAQEDEDPKQSYVDLMTARDKQEGRKRPPEGLVGLFDSVIKGSYEPPVLLNINDKLYVIGGRTRLYAGLIANKPMKVKIIKVEDLKK
jgi:hypothetical protein